MFSETMIDGVRKHKYSCVDTSPLSNYVLHPFWNYIVQVLECHVVNYFFSTALRGLHLTC